LTNDYSNNEYISRDINNLSIVFEENKNLMTVYYEFHYLYRNARENLTDDITYKYKYIIDLSKIESINYMITSFGKVSLICLNLKATSNTSIDEFKCGGYSETKEFPVNPIKVKDIQIPINDSCRDCELVDADKKILQAFNHLRKLCGAPEPIDFGN
jgi:hypothetical protein